MVSLAALARVRPLDEPAEYRLAFRELGLSIGLNGIERIQALMEKHPENFPVRQGISARLSELARFHSWVETIEGFWLEPGNQRSNSWRTHLDINSVMLATSLTRTV